MKTIFLDESGELGFSAGSSDHFLIATLECENPKKTLKLFQESKTEAS